jgi:hypothetical protein
MFPVLKTYFCLVILTKSNNLDLKHILNNKINRSNNLYIFNNIILSIKLIYVE